MLLYMLRFDIAYWRWVSSSVRRLQWNIRNSRYNFWWMFTGDGCWYVTCSSFFSIVLCQFLFRGAEVNVLSAIYDERSIRSHLRRVRELLSLSSLHVSLSTSLALQHESAQGKSAGTSGPIFFWSALVLIPSIFGVNASSNVYSTI